MFSVTYNAHVFHLGVLLFSLVAAPAWGQPVKQKWTDSTEKSTIEAEFVQLADADVVLKKDGKEIKVPLSKLSLSSHLQAQTC